MVQSPTVIGEKLRSFPDHTQLPESDGTFVFAERAVGKNFHEHPQSVILTDSIEPVLQELHPDNHYAIGQDCGIYWRETDPPEKGAEAPDWFYVPGVPPRLDGKFRRSYVLWREYVTPLIALEFASGNGTQERDKTPLQLVKGKVQKPGKFWVYEQIIHIPYYGIFIVDTGELEIYHWEDGTYQQLTTNERGHYRINRMNVELGVWRGTYLGQPEQAWLRWWDLQGNLLLTGKERALVAEAQTEQERQKRQQLAAQLKSLTPEQLKKLGIDPELLE
ncbi:MAG: Uma2 family endonuclease [Symploca sp. SIO2E6]|nr:Uma2 family endonuclease [Symploca sp. SIO2E6]